MLSNPNDAFAVALVDALHGLGVTDVCLSPGSRNTPVTLAFAGHDGIRDWIHHDERSAGFFAIGLARASGRAVALVCTSGTAAVEYHAAVVEAAQSRVPLLILTADRPPELRDVGAPQAIDQIKLYGDAVKWFHQGAPPDEAAVSHAPHLAARAWGIATEDPAGPVHLNLPFREPLHGAPSATSVEPVQRYVTSSLPTVGAAASVPDEAAAAAMTDLVTGRRAMFVAGALPAGAAAHIDRLAVSLNAAVVADPQSGLRFGPRSSAVIAAADLLAGAGALDLDPPEVVVRWGALPTSKPVWRWLAEHSEVPQVVVDKTGRDPLRSASLIVRSDPASTAQCLAEPAPAPPDWMERWLDRDRAAIALVDEILDTTPFPNEPLIATTIAAAAPPGAALFAGSSMPIRDVDAFAAPRAEPLTVFANRGTNGIDGSISTALGVAATGVATVAHVGDVAALHDVGALATAVRLRVPLTIVVVHNDGGGIFELLPQADPRTVDPARFERVFGTPHGTDFVAIAGAFGLDAYDVKHADDLAAHVATASPKLVQVRTDRKAIAALRLRITNAIRDLIRSP